MENQIKITRLQEQMKEVNKKLDSLDRKLDKGFGDVKQELNCYVRKEEFLTVRSIVYGMVGAILTAFLTGLIYLVFK
jgi:tetrahydromethanopterin S-methyltransferase subunit G